MGARVGVAIGGVSAIVAGVYGIRAVRLGADHRRFTDEAMVSAV